MNGRELILQELKKRPQFTLEEFFVGRSLEQMASIGNALKQLQDVGEIGVQIEVRNGKIHHTIITRPGMGLNQNQ